MDLFRLPKFSRQFFRSQRSPDEQLPDVESGPMVFIASHWTPRSSSTVRVFSNCEEVELLLDGEPAERRRPDDDRISTHLAHPPYTFHMKRFRPGTLEAIGYIGGAEAARHRVRTPGAPTRLTLALDESGQPFAARGRDVAFLHAALRDEAGTLVPDAWENVWFGATGDLTLVGANPFSSEAGIASILVSAGTARPLGAVHALCLAADGEQVKVLSSTLSVGGDAAPAEIRVSTDGSDPARGAVHREGPITGAGRVRAALFVADIRLIDADTSTPKFRIAGSTAPA